MAEGILKTTKSKPIGKGQLVAGAAAAISTGVAANTLGHEALRLLTDPSRDAGETTRRALGLADAVGLSEPLDIHVPTPHQVASSPSLKNPFFLAGQFSESGRSTVSVPIGSRDAGIAHELGHAKNNELANRIGLGHPVRALRMASNTFGPLSSLASSSIAAGQKDPTWTPGLTNLAINAPALVGEASANVRAARQLSGFGGSMSAKARRILPLAPAMGSYAVIAGAPLAITAARKLLRKNQQKEKLSEVAACLDELVKIATEKVSAAFCKRCQKVHAPVCDQCGKKSGDFRSMHGPCGNCAFPNGVSGQEKVSRIVSGPDDPMLDRLVEARLADVLGERYRKVKKQKTSSALPNLAERLGNSAVNHGAGVLRNIKRTAVGFTTPADSVRRGWESGGGWRGTGKLTHHLPVGPKSLTVGFGAATAPEAFRKEDKSGHNRSRSERVGKWIGNQAGGLIGAPHGLSGGIAGGVLGDSLGGTVGRIANHARRGKERLTRPATQPVAEAT